MENLADTSVKGYELQERIGSGGFGAVYRAYQSTISREVAIKVILPGLANRPDFIRRFESEAQLIARLEHPFIVPLFDYWRDPSGAYLVMRWLRGGSLKDTLAQDSLGFDSITQIMEQITSALSAAHRNNIVHRDLKPGNILLDEDGNAYLADFGIAKDIDVTNGEITEPDQLIGSPDYLAPEQARSEPVTPQTDIYSLGVVLYELLTGSHPFPNLNGIEQIFKHLNEPLPVIDNLDPGVRDALNDVIQKATQKNPAHRYADVLEMMAALRQALSAREEPSDSEIIELLTLREQEVLQCMIDGLNNRQIAEKLFITLGTARWYTKQIYKKLGVRSRVQAIVRARELNLIVASAEDGRPTVIGGSTSISQLPPPQNPYKGLHAFQTSDEKEFFGREKLTQKLIIQMSDSHEYSRFLAVVGPSGSGKSSLVKAGLIPALWRGEIPGSEKWFIVNMLPGSRPLDELEVALSRVAADQASNLGEHLQRDENGLLRVAGLILPDDGCELVLIIDQFEEVFTLLEDEQKRQHFLDLLHAAVTDKRSRVRVVVTLRADFYDRPLAYQKFGELIRDRVETVLPLSAKELQSAIVNPSQNVGVKFEEGLAATIADEVSYQPGALPLLQYALTELFERRDNRTLTHEAYQEIGGTVGALAKRAEALYQELTDEARESTRQIFLRLVTLGEGVEDTRRRTPRDELAAISKNEDLLADIIDTFAEYRLLSLDHDPATRTPTVEVAHEAVLREWERLRNWLNESRHDVRMQRQLSNMAEDWRTSDHDKSFLLRGSRLEMFEVWIAETELVVTPQEREFLSASTAEHERQEAEKRAQKQREAHLEQRARRVLQGLVAVFLIAAVIAGGLALWANSQRVEANDQRHIAEQERDRAEIAEEETRRQASIGLAALAEKSSDRELGVLLGLEAVEHYPFTPQAFGALALVVEEFRASRNLVSSEAINNLIMLASMSPDGERVAGALRLSPNSLIILDVATSSEEISVDTHGTLCEEQDYTLHDFEWSPGGDRIAAIARGFGLGDDCGLVVLDTTSGENLLTLTDYESAARSVSWSPDGTSILTGHEDGSLTLWDAQIGIERSAFTGHAAAVQDATFSPDGRYIASASDDGTVRLWDRASDTATMVLTEHAGPVKSVEWSPDGTRIVTGGSDGLPRLWDVVSGEILIVLRGHAGGILDVSWSSDGQRIASHSLDSTVKVWDATTGGLLFEIPNSVPDPTSKIGYVEFSPDNDWLLVGGARATGPQLWETSIPYPKLFGHTYGQEWGGWSPDGTLIATSGSDGSARLWDAISGQQLEEFDQGSYWSDWSPDGTQLVFAEGLAAEALNVWDTATGEMVSRLSVEEDQYGPHHLLTSSWSPDGSMIAGADLRVGLPQPTFVWDIETNSLVATLDSGDTCHQGWPRWSPDSTRLATGCVFVSPDERSPAFVWDVATGEFVPLPSEHGWTFRTEWSPDGTRLLTTHSEGAAVIWDAETGEPIRTFTEHQGWVLGSWSPDGTLIATADNVSQLVKIWGSETGEEVMSFLVPNLILTIEWSPDGTHIILTGDGINEPIIKRIWASPDELIAHAYDCCVTRELTSEERAQFGLPQREE